MVANMTVEEMVWKIQRAADDASEQDWEDEEHEKMRIKIFVLSEKLIQITQQFNARRRMLGVKTI
jgi:hypothetical protein